MSLRKLLQIGAGLFFLLVAFYTLFNKLGDNPLNIWDEARLANNAIEMIDNGDYIVTHYEGEPDMWCTKPPLMVWFQVASINLIGYNELAIRLPSAIAGLLTCFVLMFFSKRIFGNYLIGYAASYVLLGLNAYVGFHVTRTGDHDAILILFTTIMVLSTYTFMVTGENKYLYLAAIGLTFGMYAKGVAAGFFVPVIAVWVLVSVPPKSIFKNIHFYLALSIVVIVGLGYYALRESQNPGFITAVFENELGGRFNESIDNNGGSFSYYFTQLVEKNIKYWDGFLIGALLFFGFVKSKEVNPTRRLVLYLTTCVVFIILVLSAAATKNAWYDSQVYPLIALIVGCFIYHVIQAVTDKYRKPELLTAAILLSIFVYPIHTTIKQSFTVDEYKNKDNRYGPYTERLADKFPEMKSYGLVTNKYSATAKFFRDVYSNQRGYNIKTKLTDDLAVGDTIALCEPDVRERVDGRYNYKLLDDFNGCGLLILTHDKVLDVATTKADSSTLISNNG